jgi:hypothetical protein
MKRFFAVALVLACAAGAYAQRAPAGKVGTFRFEDKREGHTSRLVFGTGAFEPSRHRITFGKPSDPMYLKVDGRGAFGVDGNTPRTEIKSVEFYFDGRRVAVPRGLYSDCFNPNFGADYFAVKNGDDSASVLVFMAGGDAAGSYQVIWVLRKDGRHSRFTNPCSDCDYRGLMTFFIDQFAPRP